MTVTDEVGNDVGTFDSFELTFFGFDPDLPAPDPPNITTPRGIIDDTTPQFRWTQELHAETHNLQVESLPTQTLIIDQAGITEFSYQVTDRLPEGEYRARVNATNSEGDVSDWGPWQNFTIEVAAPDIPVLLEPTGEFDIARPEYLWEAADNAETYELRVTERDTNRVVYQPSSIRTLSYVHFVNLENGDYTAQVRAINEAGETSLFSNPLNFTIEVPAAEKPVITSPGSSVTRRRPTFRWTVAEDAVSYELKLYNESQGRLELRQNGITSTSFRPPRALDEGTYRLEVRGINEQGDPGEWSDPLVVEIDVPTPGVPELTSPTEGDVLDTQRPLFTLKERANRAVEYILVVLDADQDDAEVLRKTIRGAQRLEYQVTRNLPQTDNLVALIASVNSVGERSDFAVVNFGIDLATPGRTEFITPNINGNGTIDTDRPEFSWTAAENAIRYDLFVRNAANGRVVLKETNTKELSHRFTERLDQNVRYNVTVVGENTANERGRVAEISFVVDVPEPDTPIMFGPSGDITQRRPYVDFENVAFADRFQLFVKNLDTNSTVRYNVNDWQVSGDGEIASFRIPDRLNLGTYQAWVRALNSVGEASGNSNVVTFTVVSSSESVSESQMPQLPVVEPKALVVENTETDAIPEAAEVSVTTAKPTTVIVEPNTAPTPVPAPAPTQSQAASVAAMAEMTDADWWELMSEGEAPSVESPQQVEEANDESVEVGAAELGVAAAIAVPAFAGKLLKRVRRRRKKNE